MVDCILTTIIISKNVGYGSKNGQGIQIHLPEEVKKRDDYRWGKTVLWRD